MTSTNSNRRYSNVVSALDSTPTGLPQAIHQLSDAHFIPKNERKHQFTSKKQSYILLILFSVKLLNKLQALSRSQRSAIHTLLLNIFFSLQMSTIYLAWLSHP